MTKNEFIKEKQKILKSMSDTVCLSKEEAECLSKELNQYRELGTVEECREARERQRGKKPKNIIRVDEETSYMECGNCGLTTVLYSGMVPDYCPKCGQKLDWSE